MVHYMVPRPRSLIGTWHLSFTSRLFDELQNEKEKSSIEHDGEDDS